MVRPRKLLPECSCDAAEGLCPVHGLGERAKALRNAQRAIKVGKLAQSDYDAWIEKYPRPSRKRFGKPLTRADQEDIF